MSSGVKVCDEVKTLYKDMKLRHSGADESQAVKLALFVIRDGKIVVDSTLKNVDLQDECDIYEAVSKRLIADKCCYALYDCKYRNSETPKEELVFIRWAPDKASVKEKMVYASSAQNLQKVFEGIKFSCQWTDEGDKSKEGLKCKLQDSNSMVVEIEGRCCT